MFDWEGLVQWYGTRVAEGDWECEPTSEQLQAWRKRNRPVRLELLDTVDEVAATM